MAVTEKEINEIHHFASLQVNNGGQVESLESLVPLWQSARHRVDTNARIRQGIDEMNASLGQPLAEAIEERRNKLDISSK